MADYSIALKKLEDESGLKVDKHFEENFSTWKFEHTLPLIRMLNRWKIEFENTSRSSDTLSLSRAEDTSNL